MIRGLFGRLLVAMCSVAAASTVLVAVYQERSLARDLEEAAERRLERAAGAASRLVEDHLQAMVERYAAVSGTPQLRATLEVNDAPTLAHFAGTLLARQGAERIAFVTPSGDIAAGAGDELLDALGLGLAGHGVAVRSNTPYAVVRTPLGRAGQLLSIERISDSRLESWSELCGAELHFADADAADGLQRVLEVPGGAELHVSSDLAAERHAMANARASLAVAAAMGLALAFGVSLIVSRNLVRPIGALQGAAHRIGEGDLLARAEVDRRDEIGDVARAFERMSRGLRETLRGVERAADRVDETAGRIGASTERVLAVSGAQQRDNEQASQNLAAIAARLAPIAAAAGESAGQLEEAVDGSSASFRQLGVSGEALRRIAQDLRARAEEIEGSVEQTAGSAAGMTRDADALVPAVEAVSGRVDEMTSAASSVNAHVVETARLSEGVVGTAREIREAILRAVEGVEATQETIAESERVIDSLSGRVQDIGGIITVIDSVAEETSLLSLNGAIIAARAGEHGRSFAVVVEQLSALASRVQASTKEIDALVRGVRDESALAVDAIGRGRQRAEEGVTLIRRAESSFDEIAEASHESGDRMQACVEETGAQIERSTSVLRELEKVREAVARIHAAVGHQSREQESVRGAALALTAVAREVEANVALQTGGASELERGVELARSAVAKIGGGLEEQLAASREAADVVEASRAHTQAQEASARELEGAAADLEREAEALRAGLQRFQIGVSD